MQDPEKYMNDLGLEVSCAVWPRKRARINKAHRINLNHEVYFFNSKIAMRIFRARPYKYCGLVTDPVSLERFEPRRRSPKMTWEDRMFYFQDKESLLAFAEDPDKYLAAPTKMVAGRQD